ncbi:hypothetical protein BO219_09165 [Anoxybacillus kestanbolensis]|uniref:UPF0756 membrane protein BO219_09165 n=1 Tax=Anoxybacillus kestanbolensis TaxID=227476 RepID=A0A1V3FLZ9_9BACL|nr:DUF441 domain-containing protein [Anoxybacillus kestanbolensis]OOE02655.1 hypothetical protein BO219_09165 [Anoxybacillus kestanbolensis]QAV27499.1 DUF441 domain-containing protein [Neobacillus thermocopriae]
MQPFIFLFILFVVGIIAKNQSLIIAVLFLLIVKSIGLSSKVLPYLEQKGIHLGVTIITIAVLVPIATGKIGFKELTDSVRSIYAWIAMLSGIAVALLAKGGVTLLAKDPHVTTALVLGTILAVSLFKGVAVGPLIGAGIAYVIMKIVDIFS